MLGRVRSEPRPAPSSVVTAQGGLDAMRYRLGSFSPRPGSSDYKHLLTSEHTLSHWPKELYLPSPVIDRLNREAWQKAGSPTLEQRAHAEVENRLAAFVPPPLDPALDSEMRRLIQSGMAADPTLPAVPLPPEPKTAPAANPRRERRRAREQERQMA